MLKRCQYPNVLTPNLDGVKIQDGVIVRSFPCGGTLVYYFAKDDRGGHDLSAVMKGDDRAAWDIKHFGVKCPAVGKYEFMRCAVIERVLEASAYLGNANAGGCTACGDDDRPHLHRMMSYIHYLHRDTAAAPGLEGNPEWSAENFIDESADRRYYSQNPGCYYAGRNVARVNFHARIIAFFKRLFVRRAEKGER